jgi:nitrate/TMAO reductase-like tetraheme cytochrome c subunit
MQAWIDFLTTDYGLMSLAVLVLMFVMLGYISWYVAKHVKEDTERHDRLVREGKVAN